MGILKHLRSESGAALLLAILFSLIINGIALTLFATSREETVSSNSMVVADSSFNVAEAGLNIGLLRLKALVEANDPIDASKPFSDNPFKLETETDGDTLTIDEFRYFDLVSLTPLSDSSLSAITANNIDAVAEVYTAPIEGYFVAETSNPDMFGAYLSGAVPVYSSLVDTGENTLLRGWRIYIANDNDGIDKTARLVSVGYMVDPSNNVLYQKKIEAKVYIHGKDNEGSTDMSGQVTSSERGARTGKFRVTSDLAQPVNSYDLR